jgi:hypothetical protein
MYIYWSFLSILHIPENILAFISGILLSAAINIATGIIGEDGISKLPINITISMLLMFVASILFMVLAVIVKPIQEYFNTKDESSKKYIKKEMKSNPWYESVKDQRRVLTIVLPIILFITLLTSVLSIWVLFKPTAFGMVDPSLISKQYID